MQFTKLRLVGFKSFVEPVEFVIEPGLNGIVGPNGCGKSNLVEALRWVMGENSYKNMRASGMEDVIFSGSNSRPGRNWAEVTLTLDNRDRAAAAHFVDEDELQVSRRIERDKGSIYRINGREVRARDVQLLFADQSTGARSPSMVGQGRIGELIAAKPQARRALLEEAAGISGLHSRRHEAELRLRAAHSNLERLDDVTGELATRIEALKRQVRQASRFKILSREIRKNEAALFYLRWCEAKSMVAAAEAELNQATMAVAEQAGQQAQLARAQEQSRQALPSLREAAATAAASYQHINISLQALEEEQKRRLERRAEQQRIFEQLRRDEKRERDLMADNDAMLARLEREEEALKQASQEFIIKQEERQVVIAKSEAELSALEHELSHLTIRRAEADAAFAQKRRQMEELTARIDRLEVEMMATHSALATLMSGMAEFDTIKTRRAALAAAVTQLQDWEEEAVALEEGVSEARQESETAQAYLGKIQMRLSVLQAQESTLEKMLLAVTGQGALLDEIEVKGGFEQALGSALGDDLMVGLDASAALFWRQLPRFKDDPDLPAHAATIRVTPLLDHVKAPTVLHRRLSQIGVVGCDVSEEEAAAMQESLKIGQVLVNQQGALWRWDGLTVRADAPTAAAQRLDQRNQLQDVKSEIAIVMAQKTKSELEARNAGDKLQISDLKLRARREDIKNQRQLCESQRRDLENLEKKQLATIQRRQHLEETQNRLKDEHDLLQQQLQQVQDHLATAPDMAALAAEIVQMSHKVNSTRQQWQQAKAASQAAIETQTQNLHRLEAITLERNNWLGRIDNAHKQIKDLSARQEALMAEMEASGSVGDNFAECRQELLDKLTKAELFKQQQADILAQAETAQAMLDKQATQAIEKLSARREARARSEERLNAAGDKCRDIEHQIAETLQQQPHELLGVAEISPGKSLPEMASLEQALERSRIERERLGAVNLRAEEEAAEMSARYQAITGERDDVVQAVKKLRQAIHRLNQEGRERLLAAFDVVNEQFQRLFTHLFGGGTAQLQLIESDDPLEAGLEILARPPGKKPQTMTLLSGGEQALTAMALIFAVFLTNPAPICVLDEVDAPLDDHNVERYCNLLDEMVRLTKTRFIVITHNPITMARMARLFGVTMGEQGVSQLVSVDLAKAALMSEAS